MICISWKREFPNRNQSIGLNHPVRFNASVISSPANKYPSILFHFNFCVCCLTNIFLLLSNQLLLNKPNKEENNKPWNKKKEKKKKNPVRKALIHQFIAILLPGSPLSWALPPVFSSFF